MKSSLEAEFSYLPRDIIIYEEEDFKRSREYAIIERYVTTKLIPTSAPKKKRVPLVKPEEIVSFNVSHLRGDLFVSEGTDLVIKSEGKKCYCIGVYNRSTKEILPLTPEKRKYCESIEMKVLDI